MAQACARVRARVCAVGCTALAHTAAAAAEIEQPARPARIAVDELALDIVVEPLELEGRTLCFTALIEFIESTPITSARGGAQARAQAAHTCSRWRSASFREPAGVLACAS